MGQYLDLVGVNISYLCFSARELACRFGLQSITRDIFNNIIWIRLTDDTAYRLVRRTRNWLAVLVNVMDQHLDLVSVNIGDFLDFICISSFSICRSGFYHITSNILGLAAIGVTDSSI